MKLKPNIRTTRVVLLLFFSLAFGPSLFAHCDTMDGPVVKAAQEAIRTGNVNVILIWVQKKDESEVREKLRQTLVVRKLNEQARELADNYFFETVVRLHRAGEGEPYTGLKPLGTDLGPVIPVADKSFTTRSADQLLKLFPATARANIEARFQDAVRRQRFNINDVEAGREYVKAYISFMHFIEELYEHKAEG
ncbi:MAG TPA: DUF6448 family protein [Pyrinomonadaceae bacterium]|nr:DUF6448 family protein [Pyrinomonadaceae bacterium]